MYLISILKQILFTFLFLCTGFAYSYAQQNEQPRDTLELGEVTVKAARLSSERRFQPVQITVVDSVALRQFPGTDIRSVLENRTQLFIRNNGPGGLATVSVRGLAARQTQILWNGFNLNHPMLGLTDLSLIPTGLVNRMEVIGGQSATAYGNAAAGGAVWLESGLSGKNVSLNHTTGSFGKSVSSGKVSWSDGKWTAGLWGRYENSDNDFDFRINRFNNEEGRLVERTEKRGNNDLESVNLMAQGGYKSGSYNMESLVWFFNSDNRLPGGLQSLSETTRQEDRAIRWFTRSELDLGSSQLEFKTLFNRQVLDFFDSAPGIESVSRTRAVSLDANWRWQAAPRFRVSLLGNAGHTNAATNNFNGNQSQWQFSFSGNTIWQPFVPLHVFTGLRYDYFEISGDDISASLGFNYNLVEDILFIKSEGSRNFVAPTFNDLFWVPGGNRELEAETNYKIEGGIQLLTELPGFTADLELTGFRIRQHDGIRWIPDARTGIFSPVNIDEIGTSGFEARLNQSWHLFRPLKVDTRFSIGKTRASVKRDRFDDNRTVGKQLPQVPELSLRAGANFGWKNASAGFSYIHNSERYTTPDHSSPLDPLRGFEVSDIFAGYDFRINNYEAGLFVRVNNVFDERYEVIRNFPMPGRHFELSVRFEFFP